LEISRFLWLIPIRLGGLVFLRVSEVLQMVAFANQPEITTELVTKRFDKLPDLGGGVGRHP